MITNKMLIQFIFNNCNKGLKKCIKRHFRVFISYLVAGARKQKANGNDYRNGKKRQSLGCVIPSTVRGGKNTLPRNDLFGLPCTYTTQKDDVVRATDIRKVINFV